VAAAWAVLSAGVEAVTLPPLLLILFYFVFVFVFVFVLFLLLHANGFVVSHLFLAWILV
jgi:hypothetical protein